MQYKRNSATKRNPEADRITSKADIQPPESQGRSVAGAVLSIVWLTTTVSAAAQLHGAETPPRVPPVTDALELWFDAAQLVDEKLSGDAPVDGRAIALWSDARDHARSARQPESAAQPQLMRVGPSAVVRFDGVDDHLRLTGLDRSLATATLFVVAAPRENPGGFRAFLASNETGRRDFETGFTVDMGPFPTALFNQLNVEGRGFVGARSLARTSSPFGRFHVLEVTIDPTEQHIRLSIDGQPQDTRPFDPAAISMDEVTLGARYYNLAPGPQHATGFAAVDLAEILIYGRVLADEEASRVREHLLAKHAALARNLPPVLPDDGRIAYESILNPPPVQMFVPGFEVRELPLQLPNINNVRYRPDGKLVALAYDGDVYLLDDTNGDDLQDRADLFWKNDGRVRSPIGMALTPPGYGHGQGLFVATKSECLLLVDTDGDDRVDREIVVASGWNETFHNVDALGVAIDPRDQSIYFGLGTANFVDPYLKDQQGQAGYRLDGERASIIRVSPDFSSRETFSTGIRFPVALAFNAQGDLFCTDQEGATWVPNGNPFDELLHLVRGRHYGFPPRHPVHLPQVIDEPSVYDYTPQHQSTCGLVFNDPLRNDARTFGPEFWTGDAIVCGYSRGKLYRTKLAKTPLGYVADNRLLACLNMLTVDSCVSPAGDLVVAVHSGGPDWGSGPSGMGRLYRIRYLDPAAPQPVAAWAAGTNEVHVAFDRPLDAEDLHGLADATRITFGEHVRAGDEFESLRPGYEVVGRQMASPRFELAVHSAQVTPDLRTLILVTDAHSLPVHYAVRLPGLDRAHREGDADDAAARPTAVEPGESLAQFARIDLDYSLAGVAAEWQVAGEAGAKWTGWLPHIDPEVSAELLAATGPHEQLRGLLGSPGRLRLRTQIELSNMLQPAVQPGSKLDFSPPAETVTLRLEASAPFTVRTPGGETVAAKDGEGGDRYVAEVVHGPITAEADSLLPMEINLTSERGNPRLTVAWHTAEDDRVRPLPLRRFLLPWARSPSDVLADEAAEQPRIVPELAGGHWGRGRKLFFSEETLCSKCHTVRGEGGAVGPDLSNLVHRDYASVLRDITQPSYAINPDYISHTLQLASGHTLVGTLRSSGDDVLIGDSEGKVVTIPRDDIETSAPTSQSIMPEDIAERLSPEQRKDLLTYLLTPPPHMPLNGPQPPPPPRPASDLHTVLAGAPDPPEPTRPIHVVLVAGPKDHGPGEHDYPAWQEAWSDLLALSEDTSVATAWQWPSAEDLAAADVLVFYQQGTWTPERARDIDAFLGRGGGLVYIHYAVDGGRDAPGFAQRIGLAWQGGRSKFRHGPLELEFPTTDHPIARNFSHVEFVDESYWNLVTSQARPDVLASGLEDGQPQPLFWTLEPAGGRVFVSIPGHFSWTFDDPLFRVLLLRGIAWVAREPVDRFNDLAPVGARLAPVQPNGS